MGVVIIKPRAVIRQVLTDSLNRTKFDAGTLAYIDTILAKDDDQWSRGEFRKMLAFFSDCDD